MAIAMVVAVVLATAVAVAVAVAAGPWPSGLSRKWILFGRDHVLWDVIPTESPVARREPRTSSRAVRA